MKHLAVRKFEEIRKGKQTVAVYESSITKKKGCIFFLMRENLEKKLVTLTPHPEHNSLLDCFVAEEKGKIESGARIYEYQICPCSHENAMSLRKIFPYTCPMVIGLAAAIGTGDRVGLATPGHIRAVKGFDVFPVLAQQSVREMERTLRTPWEVLDDVSWAVFQENYQRGFAADADHVKKEADLDAAFEAGFTMYTVDPSDHVDNGADNYDLGTLRKKFEALPWAGLKYRKEDCLKAYLGKEFAVIGFGEKRLIKFSEETLLRAAVKYSAAIAHTVRMHRHLKRLYGRKRFDLEMSVDETETPTSTIEHFFIASELNRLGVQIQGLAPRFVGKFEKAIDYIGDLGEFERSFKEHVLIAKTCGPYKLSIHSGSDKFSIYPIVGRLAADVSHLKTAGTSYLEALRVVARHDPRLFREIAKFSLKCFEKDRKSYHLSTNLSLVPNPDTVADKDLEKVLLDEKNGRQLMHVTFGSVLTAKTGDGKWLFRERLNMILVENEEEHYETVAAHIRRHAEAIWVRSKH